MSIGGISKTASLIPAHERQVLELCLLQVHICVWRRQRPVLERGKKSCDRDDKGRERTTNQINLMLTIPIYLPGNSLGLLVYGAGLFAPALATLQRPIRIRKLSGLGSLKYHRVRSSPLRVLHLFSSPSP